MPLKIYRDLSGKVSPDCYTQGRDGHPVLVLVCHNTAGPGDFNTAGQSLAVAQQLSDQAANYLTNNDRQVSIHWVVGAEACGAPIYRVVPETDTAYHCGGTPPQFPSHWVNPDDGQAYGRFGLNQVAIGIELFGQESDTVGPNQLASLKALVLDIASRYPILTKPGHIVAHKELEGDRRDGVNWVQQARSWVAGGNAVSGGNGQTGNDTDPYGVADHWHAIVPGIGDFYVVEPILNYWRSQGGLSEFGYPLSGYRPASDGSGKFVQYFERARLEFDPVTGKVQRGRIGADYLALAGAKAL